MKNRSQSFSFMMEMIITIFFFALASTVCVSFIASSKKNIDESKYVQSSLLEAQNIINTMQSQKDKSIEELFDVTKENEIYQYNDMTIKIYEEENIKKGIITITDDIELEFVIGESYGE